MTEISPSIRLLAALQRRAVNGIATLSRTELRRETGISERSLGMLLHRMIEAGAVEMLRPGGGNISARYRVLRAEAVVAEAMWTEARVAMMRAEYASTPRNVDLAERLNTLPGKWIDPDNVMDWAARNGLKKDRPAPAKAESPKSVSGMRFASSVTSRSPVIAWNKLPAAKARTGCAWALTCDEPATRGAWCERHAALLRRVA